VPVADLAVRFGRAASPVTKRTCIVIVEVATEEERQVVGVVVDAVNEVLDIPASDIEPPPSFGARIRTDFIEGMGKVNGKFVILLDVNHVLALDDLAEISQAAAESAV
jgi:purine-binding chemotaxis protein CheW